MEKPASALVTPFKTLYQLVHLGCIFLKIHYTLIVSICTSIFYIENEEIFFLSLPNVFHKTKTFFKKILSDALKYD